MEQFIFRHIKKIRQKENGLIPGSCVLIRTHTVATGSDSCDYWYVPDKSETAINYTGVII